MANAKLRQQGVDRADLFAFFAAEITQIGGLYMIIPVRHEKWDRCEMFDDQRVGFRSGESLQQFL